MGSSKSQAKRPGGRRKQDAYQHAKDSKQNSRGIPPGSLIYRPNAQIQVFRPKFKSKDALIMRPLPALEDVEPIEAAEWLPAHDGVGTGYIHDFMRTYPTANYVGVGKERYSFILYSRRWLETRQYRANQNPWNVLYWTIWRALKSKDGIDENLPAKWNILLDGKNSYLNAEKDTTFIQGLVLFDGKKKYGSCPKGLAEDDVIPVCELTSSAAEAFEELLYETRDDLPEIEDEDEVDPAKYFKYGDPLDPNAGRFLRLIGTPDDEDEDTSDDFDMTGGGGKRKKRKKKSDDGGFSSYSAALDKHLTFNGKKFKTTAEIREEDQQLLKKRIQFWDEILVIPEEEQLCEMIALALAPIREVVEYGWSEHPEFLEYPGVQKHLRNAKQIPMGASVPGGGKPTNKPKGEGRLAGASDDAFGEPEDDDDTGTEDVFEDVDDDDPEDDFSVPGADDIVEDIDDEGEELEDDFGDGDVDDEDLDEALDDDGPVDEEEDLDDVPFDSDEEESEPEDGDDDAPEEDEEPSDGMTEEEIEAQLEAAMGEDAEKTGKPKGQKKSGAKSSQKKKRGGRRSSEN